MSDETTTPVTEEVVVAGALANPDYVPTEEVTEGEVVEPTPEEPVDNEVTVL